MTDDSFDDMENELHNETTKELTGKTNDITITSDGQEYLVELPNLHLSRFLDVYRGPLDVKPLDRPRGILSPTDREYLFGFKDYEHKQSEANRRQDIRERVANSLKDFKILWTRLDEKDRSQVFSQLGEEEVDECIEAIISFLHLGIGQEAPRFEKAIERGLLAGENAITEESAVGKAKRVDVSIDIDYYPDADAIEKKLERNPASELTVEELGVLAEAGKLEPRDIEKLNDSKIHPPENYFGDNEDQPTLDKDPINNDADKTEGDDSDP